MGFTVRYRTESKWARTKVWQLIGDLKAIAAEWKQGATFVEV